jgi:hypothetical protein
MSGNSRNIDRVEIVFCIREDNAVWMVRGNGDRWATFNCVEDALALVDRRLDKYRVSRRNGD